MITSTKGNLTPMNAKASPFMLRAKTAASTAAVMPQATHAADSVRFTGGNQSIELMSNVFDNRIITVPHTLDIGGSKQIGAINAGDNIWANDSTVTGNVTAENGEIEFLSSDAGGVLKAGKDIKATESADIHAIHAGGSVETDDVLVKGDVTADTGNIDFVNSDAKGQLKTLKGGVYVNDSDEIGSIDSAGVVNVKDAKNIKGTIAAGDDVTLQGNTVVNDILIRKSKSGVTPAVHIGEGVTVKGNIKFEDGNGQVFFVKGANLLGKTIGGKASEVKQLKTRDINYCDPNKDDYKDDKDCDPTISKDHNPFNLSDDQLKNAQPCSAAAPNSRGPSKGSMLLGALLAGGLILPNILGVRR